MDYAAQFSGRRGIGIGPNAPAGDRPGIFADFRPSELGPLPEPGVDLNAASRNYARAWSDAERMRELGLPVLENHTDAVERAGRVLDAARPGLSDAMDRRLRGDPALAEQARRGETRALLRGAEQDRVSASLQGQGRLKQGPERERSLGQELPPPTRGRGLDRGWER